MLSVKCTACGNSYRIAGQFGAEIYCPYCGEFLDLEEELELWDAETGERTTAEFDADELGLDTEGEEH